MAAEDPRDVSQPQNYAGAATSSPSVVDSLVQRQQSTASSQVHHRALIGPDSQNTAVREPESLTITFTSHRQPYGCGGSMIHAASPRRLVPPIK
jgi:hypothetical protein